MNLKPILITLLILTAIGVLLQQEFIQKPVLELLKQKIPWSISTFGFVKDNVTSGSLMGLLLYLIFVNIPVLPSPPAETYIIFAFLKGTNIFGILLITILIYMLFAAIYYFIGRFFGQRVIEKLLKRPVGYIPILDRFMGPIIFFAHIIPMPLPIPLGTISILFAGYYKAQFNKVMVAVGMGMLFRIVIILILYKLFTPTIEHYLSPLNLLKIG